MNNEKQNFEGGIIYPQKDWEAFLKTKGVTQECITHVLQNKCAEDFKVEKEEGVGVEEDKEINFYLSFMKNNCSDNYNLHEDEETKLIYLCVDRKNADELRKVAEQIVAEKRKTNGELWFAVCGICDNHK